MKYGSLNYFLFTKLLVWLSINGIFTVDLSHNIFSKLADASPNAHFQLIRFSEVNELFPVRMQSFCDVQKLGCGLRVF